MARHGEHLRPSCQPGAGQILRDTTVAPGDAIVEQPATVPARDTATVAVVSGPPFWLFNVLLSMKADCCRHDPVPASCQRRVTLWHHRLPQESLRTTGNTSP
jgi:hypothetical protein